MIESKPCFLTPKRIQPQYPLLIFLPGMDGTGQLLRSQTAGLEIGFDVRCLAIPRHDLTSWEELTHNVLDLIHAELEQSPQRPVYLCGESFGGCLAMKVATTSPQLFSRIVLVNPASSFQRYALLNTASQFANLVHPCLFQFGALGLMPFIAALQRMGRIERQHLLKTMRSVPPETVLWRLSLLRNFNVDDTKLQQINQAVLLIASDNDRLLPSLGEVKRLSKVFPNHKLVTLPQSGHACLLEKDVNLYEIMKYHNFLDIPAEAVRVSV